MIQLLILICVVQLLTLAVVIAFALSHRDLIHFITRRFYDIELKIKDPQDD